MGTVAIGPTVSTTVRRALAVTALSATVACAGEDVPVFRWDGARTVTALSIDGRGPNDATLLGAIDDRRTDGDVAMLYGHTRAGHASIETVAALVERAADAGLPMLTFADLVAGPPRAGICLSLDDDDFAEWATLPAGSRVTLFVTRYRYASDAERGIVQALADAGHDIEAHGVNHVHAQAYVAEHGLEAYVADEVLGSITDLAAFAPVAFAHPFGETSPAIDAAILDADVPLIRGIARD